MSYKRLLTIQDISCVGQCSLTVALPIISACGIDLRKDDCTGQWDQSGLLSAVQKEPTRCIPKLLRQICELIRVEILPRT